MFNRGVAHERGGKFGPALADFRTALSLDPSMQKEEGKHAAESIRRLEQKIAEIASTKAATSAPPPIPAPQISPR